MVVGPPIFGSTAWALRRIVSSCNDSAQVQRWRAQVERHRSCRSCAPGLPQKRPTRTHTDTDPHTHKINNVCVYICTYVEMCCDTFTLVHALPLFAHQGLEPMYRLEPEDTSELEPTSALLTHGFIHFRQAGCKLLSVLHRHSLKQQRPRTSANGHRSNMVQQR